MCVCVCLCAASVPPGHCENVCLSLSLAQYGTRSGPDRTKVLRFCLMTRVDPSPAEAALCCCEAEICWWWRLQLQVVERGGGVVSQLDRGPDSRRRSNRRRRNRQPIGDAAELAAGWRKATLSIRPNLFVDESLLSSSWPFPSSSWVSPLSPSSTPPQEKKRGMPWMPLPGPACENVCGALNHAV